MDITIDALAAEPRWPEARVRGLPGRSRGDLIGPWSKNVAARFGDDAVARVRKRLAPPLDQIPAVLGARDWVPVHAQLELTDAIVDELLGGDMRALAPLLVEDTRASMGRVHLVLLRTLGPKRALRLAPRTFRNVHERGSVTAEIERRRVRMTFSGTPLFTHPGWRLLQLFAMRALLELTETAGSVVGEAGGDDHFVAVASW